MPATTWSACNVAVASDGRHPIHRLRSLITESFRDDQSIGDACTSERRDVVVINAGGPQIRQRVSGVLSIDANQRPRRLGRVPPVQSVLVRA